MNKIKKGDIVGRKSYGKDIVFVVTRIISTKKERIALLKGLYERIEADSNIEDLEIIAKEETQEIIKNIESKINSRINKNSKHKLKLLQKDNRIKERIITGKILHLDGECSFIYTLQSCLNTEFKKI